MAHPAVRVTPIDPVERSHRSRGARPTSVTLLIALAAVVGLGLPAMVPSPAVAHGRGPAGTRPPAPFAVDVRTATFVDPTRPTPAHNGVPAESFRRLVTTIFYPAAGRPGGVAIAGAPAARGGRPFPLLVFAHGATAEPSAFADVLTQWAAAGFVIAAPKFPLTGATTPGGPDPSDFPNQPKDLSVVITRMLSLSRADDSPYAGLISRHRIGAVGTSLGAITTIGLGYNSCCIDPRVKAIASISGAKDLPGVGSFGGAFTYPPTPLLLIRGGNATLDPAFDPSQTLFDQAKPPKFLLTVALGTHVPIQPTAGGLIARRAVIDFFGRYLDHEPGAICRLVHETAVPGVVDLQQVHRHRSLGH